MNWFLLTVLAITARGVYSIATKLLSNKVEVSPVTQAVLLTTSAGALAIPVSFLVGDMSFSGIGQYWLSVIVMIVAQAFGNILFFAGVKRLDAGMTQIAFSSILIWGAILSIIFLDSSFTAVQSMGIILMLTAILTAQYKKGKKNLDPGVLYIIGGAALFAVFQVASADLAETISTGAYLMLAYFGPSLLLGLIYSKTLMKDWVLLKKQLKKTTRSTLFASSTNVLYFLFSYLAFQVAPDRGVVVVLLTAQVILSVVLGIIFLKEKDNVPRKVIAAVLAFAAGALIRS